MSKRTSPSDAVYIEAADDLEHLVLDKRESWRANNAKARRRQRRYKKLMLHEAIKLGPGTDDAVDDSLGLFGDIE